MSSRANEGSTPLGAEGAAPRASNVSPPPAERQRGALRASAPVLLIFTLSGALVAAALPPDRGEVALALMLRKLATVGTFMHVTAHPDDEPNGLMAMQSRGLGVR